ncbi:MAG: recombinase family protein [Gammaproteobacteria bacterium]|nr:recombinase family protein [Gammaproteobacteria bacterium]
MLIGYVGYCVNELESNKQIKILEEAGCKKVFVEKVLDDQNSRPNLDLAISSMQVSDILVVITIKHVATSLKELMAICRKIFELSLKFHSELGFKSLKEPEFNTESHHGKAMFQIFSVCSKFDHEYFSPAGVVN